MNPTLQADWLPSIPIFDTPTKREGDRDRILVLGTCYRIQLGRRNRIGREAQAKGPVEGITNYGDRYSKFVLRAARHGPVQTGAGTKVDIVELKLAQYYRIVAFGYSTVYHVCVASCNRLRCQMLALLASRLFPLECVLGYII